MYQYFFNNLIVILYRLSGNHFHIFAAGDEARRVQWIDNGKNSRLRRFQSFGKKSCKKSPTNRKFLYSYNWVASTKKNCFNTISNKP